MPSLIWWWFPKILDQISFDIFYLNRVWIEWASFWHSWAHCMQVHVEPKYPWICLSAVPLWRLEGFPQPHKALKNITSHFCKNKNRKDVLLPKQTFWSLLRLWLDLPSLHRPQEDLQVRKVGVRIKSASLIIQVLKKSVSSGNGMNGSRNERPYLYVLCYCAMLPPVLRLAPGSHSGRLRCLSTVWGFHFGDF